MLSFNPAFETIDAFVKNVQPSQVPYSKEGVWVSIRHPPEPPAVHISADLNERYRDVLETCQQKCVLAPRRKQKFRQEARDKILELAVSHGDVIGKWILFPFKEKADEVWTRIARLTYEGKLGHFSKIAAGNQRVLSTCIYTANFDDKEKVKGILRELQEAGIAKRRTDDPDANRMTASFKPDVFTRLELYHRTRGGPKIDPVIYRIDDFVEA